MPEVIFRQSYELIITELSKGSCYVVSLARWVTKKNFGNASKERMIPSGTAEKIIEMALNGSGVRGTSRVLKVSINTVISHPKNSPLHK